jgi:hypothetical protein
VGRRGGLEERQPCREPGCGGERENYSQEYRGAGVDVGGEDRSSTQHRILLRRIEHTQIGDISFFLSFFLSLSLSPVLSLLLV